MLACGCGRERIIDSFPERSPRLVNRSTPVANVSSTGPTVAQATVQPSYLVDTPSDPGMLRFAATGEFMYGPISGYVQTPAGGAPGSTSRKRPRLSELGIHTATISAAEISVFVGLHEIFGGAEIIRLSGGDTLRAPLVTHAQSFAAGTDVDSDVALDSYRVGYRYHLFAGDVLRPQLDVAPYLDLDLWNFDYRISGAGHATSRGYLKPTVQLGIDAEWSPGRGPFSLTGDFATSPPGISSLPLIASEQLAARYRFSPATRFAITATAGLRFEQYNFIDTQRVPNHIHATLGPLLIVGLGIEF
jgi:hypothetical protein